MTASNIMIVLRQVEEQLRCRDLRRVTGRPACQRQTDGRTR